MTAPRATRIRGHRKNCNCPGCAHAVYRYKKNRLLATERGTWKPLTDAAGHLAILTGARTAGWTTPQIAAVTGLDYRLTRILLGEDFDNPPPERLRAATVDAIRRLAGADRLGPVVPDAMFVDRTGSLRRIQALAANGYPQTALDTHPGVHVHDVNGVRRVTAATARRIRNLYTELADIPGPSRSAAARAAKKGWAMPAAREGIDIDDPNAAPDDPIVIDPITALVEDAEWLRDQTNESWDAIAARLLIRKDTLHQYRTRVRRRQEASTS